MLNNYRSFVRNKVKADNLRRHRRQQAGFAWQGARYSLAGSCLLIDQEEIKTKGIFMCF